MYVRPIKERCRIYRTNTSGCTQVDLIKKNDGTERLSTSHTYWTDRQAARPTDTGGDTQGGKERRHAYSSTSTNVCIYVCMHVCKCLHIWCGLAHLHRQTDRQTHHARHTNAIHTRNHTTPRHGRTVRKTGCRTSIHPSVCLCVCLSVGCCLLCFETTNRIMPKLHGQQQQQ